MQASSVILGSTLENASCRRVAAHHRTGPGQPTRTPGSGGCRAAGDGPPGVEALGWTDNAAKPAARRSVADPPRGAGVGGANNHALAQPMAIPRPLRAGR